MIKALELDRIYTHKRNKQQYRLIFFGKVQIKGQWRDAVIYQAEAGMDETMYIRTALNFKKRFIEHIVYKGGVPVQHFDKITLK